jgi:hypothetical protein
MNIIVNTTIQDKNELERPPLLPFPMTNPNENDEDRIAINENNNDPDALPNRLLISETF